MTIATVATAAAAGADIGAKMASTSSGIPAAPRARSRTCAAEAVICRRSERHRLPHAAAPPNGDVDDATLADRMRSSVGPFENSSMCRGSRHVENGTMILHGEIPTGKAETEILNAINGVAGVHDVRSHLTTA